MKKLFLIILAALMLAGCTAPAAQETTTPPTAPTEVTTATTAPPVTTEAPLETTVPSVCLDSMLADMTLRQKVGQLFIVRLEQLVPGTGTVREVTDELELALEEYPMGGVILFGDNVMKPEQLLTLNEGLVNLPGIPLFIAVDEEGGLVARLAGNWKFKLTKYDSAMAVGSSGDPADALEMGRTIGGYLSEYGFNLDFAPVADVHTNPKNPVIGTRAFSTDPVIAAQMVAAFADGLEENGIIATFKHFPGHGDTAEDSHSGLAVVYKTREELEECEFIPFREAASQDMVMVAHVALPNVTGDMTPATLSHQIVTEILKEELGFEGLVVTDAMEMGAIVETYGSGPAAVAALQAGCHIILIPEDLPEAFDAVLAALEDGTLSMDWLDETVKKILEFKQLHGIL